MRRVLCALMVIIFSATMLVSCGKTVEAKWQEQLDLGMKYLSEMDYDNAILAFTKAIEVDPNRSEAYAERAKLYVQRGAEGDLALAAADYEKAIELGGETVDIFLALASIYEELGGLERAMEVLQQGYDLTGAPGLYEKLRELQETGEPEGAEPEGEAEASQPAEPRPESVTVQGYEIPTDIEYLMLIGSDDVVINATNEEGNQYKLAEPLTDIRFLEHFEELTTLILDGNQISDLTPLSGLTNLEYLAMGENQISDISPLADLTNLQYLNLRGNQLHDISPLSELTNLEDLTLWDNQLSDISPLSGLTNLTQLVLSGNQIVDLAPLSGLASLEMLNLSENQISTLAPLSQLGNIWYLDLKSNQIADISTLSGMTNLENLFLAGNQISDGDKSALQTALPSCIISF